MTAAKRARTALRPEDVKVGTLVLYKGGKRGLVCDAFAALDQFWIRDTETGEKVKDEDGDIVAFSAGDLRSATMEAAEVGQPSQGARVLLIGTAEQMLRIIQHFGQPDASERREPQMLLAMPCGHLMCSGERFDPQSAQTSDPETCPMLRLAQGPDGVDQSMLNLAASLRPDIKDQINIRPYHLKQAVEQLGPDLVKLDDYYALASVTLPYGIHDIESAAPVDRREMEEVRCHIDLGVSAEGRALTDEATLDITAKRVLAEACGIEIGEPFWTDEVQFKLRKAMQVELPLKYWDGPEVKGYVILLPADLVAVIQDNGLLSFKQPQPNGGPAPSQSQFRHMPKLPEGWVRMVSKSNGQVYYWNNTTHKSTFEQPLPAGWTKQTSKSSGKTYYFNAAKQQSMYTIPTEP